MVKVGSVGQSATSRSKTHRATYVQSSVGRVRAWRSKWLAAVSGAAFSAWLFPGLGFAGARPLQVTELLVRQYEDGPPAPRDYEFLPNDIVHLSFRIANFTIGKEDRVRLSYRIEALDPEGRPLAEPETGRVDTEITFKDKEAGWRPIVRYQVMVPPAAPSGDYTLVVQVEDEFSKATARGQANFRVRGRPVSRSESLVIQNFNFYAEETAMEPLGRPVYAPGTSVWSRFDITGYKLGPNNRFSIEYGIRVIREDGKVLFEQPVAAQEERESFYPEWHTMGLFSLNLAPDISRGAYRVVVTVRDRIGNQTYEGEYTFRVE